MSVNADEIEKDVDNDTYVNIPYSAGLISEYEISITKNALSLYLTGTTECFTDVDMLGFKNIMVQRSSDNMHWSNYYNYGNYLISDTKYCYTENKYICSLDRGYYYRITLKHYAKEQGLFGRSESLPNTSNSVWVG